MTNRLHRCSIHAGDVLITKWHARLPEDDPVCQANHENPQHREHLLAHLKQVQEGYEQGPCRVKFVVVGRRKSPCWAVNIVT